ncbi:MAG: PilZ domain-containing protein [Spirochaetes bacterium]|nr:PilZ domain-containing protein [Spirochaetota bacterium]
MEKRRFVRMKSQFCVWYQTIDKSNVYFDRPLSKDISPVGLLIELDKKEEEGSFLMMKFKLPSLKRNISVKGQVVRVKKIGDHKYDVGIEFTDINEEDMVAIRKLVWK